MRKELGDLFNNPDIPTDPTTRSQYIYEEAVALQWGDLANASLTGEYEPQVDVYIEALAEDPLANKTDIRLLARFLDQYPHIQVNTSIPFQGQAVALPLTQITDLIEAKVKVLKSLGYKVEQTGQVIKQIYDTTQGKPVKDNFDLLTTLAGSDKDRAVLADLDWQSTIIPNLLTAQRLKDILSS